MIAGVTACQPITGEDVSFPLTALSTSVTASCSIGYIGQVARTCQADGTWSAAIGVCLRTLQCPVTSSRQKKGRADHVLTTYAPVPPHPHTRLFLRPPPKTEPCPSTTAFGASWPSTNPGTVATGTCLTGQSLVGTANLTRTCDNTGNWAATSTGSCTCTCAPASPGEQSGP